VLEWDAGDFQRTAQLMSDLQPKEPMSRGR